MMHDVEIRGIHAECSCGYSCVAASDEAAGNWAEQHLREFEPQKVVKIPDFTDDQLRAECERRGITRLGKEADELFCRIEAERDEWKRRALAAKDKLCDPKKVIRVETDAGDLVPLGSVHNMGKIELLVTRVLDDRLPFRDLILGELGPGLSAKAPSSAPDYHWVDPLDLLADDA